MIEIAFASVNPRNHEIAELTSQDHRNVMLDINKMLDDRRRKMMSSALRTPALT